VKMIEISSVNCTPSCESTACYKWHPYWKLKSSNAVISAFYCLLTNITNTFVETCNYCLWDRSARFFRDRSL